MCDRVVKKWIIIHSARGSQKVAKSLLLVKTNMTLYKFFATTSYLQCEFFSRAAECCSERLFSVAIMVTLKQLNNVFCMSIVFHRLWYFINYFLFKSLIYFLFHFKSAFWFLSLSNSGFHFDFQRQWNDRSIFQVVMITLCIAMCSEL